MFVRLFVYLSILSQDISKTDAARITRHGIEMFHSESCKPIYFGVKRSQFKVTRHTKNIDGVSLVSAGLASCSFVCTVQIIPGCQATSGMAIQLLLSSQYSVFPVDSYLWYLEYITLLSSRSFCFKQLLNYVDLVKYYKF